MFLHPKTQLIPAERQDTMTRPTWSEAGGKSAELFTPS